MKGKGTVDVVFKEKKFGFIKTEDGLKVFLPFRILPKGMTIKGGEKVEFEAEQDSKGRNPTATKVTVTQGSSEKPENCKTTSSASAAAESPEDMQVFSPLYPDQNGKFLVNILVARKKGTRNRSLKIIPTIPITVTNKDNAVLEHLNGIEAGVGKTTQLWINLSQTQVTTLTFVLDDRFKKTIYLANPTKRSKLS